MSRTLDRLDDAFPHGSPDGYRQGCRGSVCPAPLACRDVFRRYSGDLTFKRLLDAGTPLAEILAREAADAAAAVERDRAAARTQRQAERDASRPRKPKCSPSEYQAQRRHRSGLLRDNLTALHATGLTDVQLAAELGIDRSYTSALRRKLGLPANRPPKTERPTGIREERAQRFRELHAAGLTDQEIGDQIGITQRGAAALRRRLELPANHVTRARSPRVPRAPRHDHGPDIARLHGEGFTDAQIGERLGLSTKWVAVRRRKLGLRRGSKWDGVELQPHGTNACYARGCRQPECVEAHRQYHRDYVQRRRAEGAREYHGTAYGYQLGCKAGADCPATPSCADASLAAEAARRRAAGIPPKELVDAGPVQAHIRDLLHAGLTVADIADRAGLSFPIVRKMIHSRGRGRGVVREVLAERAAAVLAVPLPEGAASCAS